MDDSISMTIKIKYTPDTKEYRIDVAYHDGGNGLAFYTVADLMMDYAELCVEEFITAAEEMGE